MSASSTTPSPHRRLETSYLNAYIDQHIAEPESRLGCQAKIADEDLVVEIPKYTLNHASEDH